MRTLRRTRRALLSLTASCLLTTIQCSDRSPNVTDVTEEGKKLPDQIITGFGVTITDHGVKDTEVQAATAYVFEQEKRIEARELNVKFFSETGEYYSELWADSGTINMESNDMRAIGNVVVLTEDSLKLETASLDWDDEKEEISTQDSVTFYQKDRTVTGRGLVSDPGLEDVEILSPTGRFEKKKETQDREQ